MNDPFEFVLPPEAAQLRMLRKAARHSLRQMGVSQASRDEVVLVLDEIVSNAIEHGRAYRHGHEPLRVRMHLENSGLVLEFHDPEMPRWLIEELGHALERHRGQLPAPELERGRGLFLVAASLRDVSIETDADGTWLKGVLLGVKG